MFSRLNLFEFRAWGNTKQRTMLQPMQCLNPFEFRAWGNTHVLRRTQLGGNVLIPLNSGLGEIRRLAYHKNHALRLNPFEFRAWGNTNLQKCSRKR